MTRNVVISGGGTGIGLAAARVFAADGDRVLLLGRRGDVLERAGAEVPGAEVYAAASPIRSPCGVSPTTSAGSSEPSTY